MTEPQELTAQLVEELQYVVQMGRSINTIVNRLHGATLPGIIEYGCLRWVLGDSIIPGLPDRVGTSEVGKAMLAIRSELGLRNTGCVRALRNVQEQEVEFMVIAQIEELEGEEWKLYEARFNRSVQAVGFSGGQAGRMQGAMHEMVENALIHANSPIPALVGYRVLNRISQFVIADVGRGVLASLQTCRDYNHIKLHKDAIRKALEDGTSRFGSRNGGLGFREVFKALSEQWGQLRFRSREGCVTIDGRACDADMGVEYCPPSLPGFQVTVTCQADGQEPMEHLV